MLSVDRVSKRYGELAALTDVSVEFAPGEIHAVLGENGAGKSTLMGVISGFVSPTSGDVKLDGQTIPLGRAFECRRSGIEMIHQHFTLVEEFTVAENLALARLPGLAVSAKVTARAKPSLDAALRLGWPVDPEARVQGLAVGQRQRVEILKALGGDARVLVLDEPTAVLSAQEVDDLFRVLRQLRDEGRIVILIAHKLSEVLAVADRITILRQGRLIASVVRADAKADELALWMVGELPQPPPARSRLPVKPGGLVAVGIQVEGDRGELAVKDASFTAFRGEIVGIGGVDGNGQVELAEALAGIRPARGYDSSRNPTLEPIGYIPQDRQTDGLALKMSVEDNLLVGAFRRPRFCVGPFIRMREVKRWAKDVVARFDIRVSSPRSKAGSLSGGNQQKVVVGRTLDGQPKLLIAVNPTRGLDFRATEFVHEQIRQARDGGAAVVLVSTDVDELFALSDRRFFMSGGKLLEGDSAATYFGHPGTA